MVRDRGTWVGAVQLSRFGIGLEQVYTDYNMLWSSLDGLVYEIGAPAWWLVYHLGKDQLKANDVIVGL